MIISRFKNNWQFNDLTTFQRAPSDRIMFPTMQNKSKPLRRCNCFSTNPVSDYRELLELTIIFLGGVPSRGISFRAPAGQNRARRMAKAIYALNIWMSRSQFVLTNEEEKTLTDVYQFTVLIYVKAWFLASSAPSAPRIDLQMLKDSYLRKEQNNSASEVEMTMKGHLWYLSEELIAPC
jgi:hypothetical protein